MTGADLLDELVAQVEREPELNSIAALQARALILTDRRDELAALLLRLATNDANGNHAHHAQMDADEVMRVIDGYRRTPLDAGRLIELWPAIRADIRAGVPDGHRVRRIAVHNALHLIIGDAIPGPQPVAS